MHRSTSSKRAAFVVAVALATSIVGSALTACSDDTTKGDSIADVPFTGADGRSTTLADLTHDAATPIVVNLWATWCTPCVKEMPAFDTVADDLDGTVHVIGVNVGDSAADAVAFADSLGVAYDLFTDPDGELMTALHVTGLPATAFIAADGTLVTVHQGAYTESELRAAITEHFPTVASSTGGTQP